MSNSKWDRRFLKMAAEAASWSKDESTQVGAYIIGKHRKPLSHGYNGMPRGVKDDVPERHERPAKYLFFEHAERNAIYNSDNNLEGSTMYVTHFPCADCARAIIQNQIARVVVDAKGGKDVGWASRNPDSVNASLEMFAEAGVIIDEI